MKEDSKKKKKFDYSSLTGMGAGMLIGIAIGVAQDNIGVGVALGLVFGAAMDAEAGKRKKSTREKEENDS